MKFFKNWVKELTELYGKQLIREQKKSWLSKRILTLFKMQQMLKELLERLYSFKN
jgi:hypothetical protein